MDGVMSSMSSVAARDGEIPLLDLAPYLAGKPGALDTLAAELRFALENVGFYFIANHGVPQAQIDAAFWAARAFHAQPLEDKLALKLDIHSAGYMPMRGNTLRTSSVQSGTKPNLNEAFFVKREMPADHPDVLAARRFRGLNRWPLHVPGFRDTVLAYCQRLERLAVSLTPVYARALDLPADFFAKAFHEPQYTLRMTHYPQHDLLVDGEFGLAPHTDTSFMTLLPQNDVPGLAIKTQDGRWIDAPAIPGTFIVNGGQFLQRWTNDRFLATPHRVINRSGGERYALPFFVDTNIDIPVEPVPTCVSADNPAKYPTTLYTDYMIWYQNRNYDVLRPQGAAPADA